MAFLERKVVDCLARDEHEYHLPAIETVDEDSVQRLGMLVDNRKVRKRHMANPKR